MTNISLCSLLKKKLIKSWLKPLSWIWRKMSLRSGDNWLFWSITLLKDWKISPILKQSRVWKFLWVGHVVWMRKTAGWPEESWGTATGHSQLSSNGDNHNGGSRICHYLSWLLQILQLMGSPNQLPLLLLMLEAVSIVTSMVTWQGTVLSHIETMVLKEGEEEVVGDRCLCYLPGEEEVDAEEEINVFSEIELVYSSQSCVYNWQYGIRKTCIVKYNLCLWLWERWEAFTCFFQMTWWGIMEKGRIGTKYMFTFPFLAGWSPLYSFLLSFPSSFVLPDGLGSGF